MRLLSSMVVMVQVSSAFQPAQNYNNIISPSLLTVHHNKRQSSILFRPSTSLYGKDDDNKDDDSRSFNNKLDIFGQPKDKPKQFDDDMGEIRGPDRIKSCIPYILPLIDGDGFGKYIYERIPPLGTLDYLLLRPLVEGVNAAPLLGIVIFTAFALGPQLTGQSREVRFNAQEAVLIDIALIIPELVRDAVRESDAKFPRAFVEPCSNFVWYFYVSLVVYSVVSNLRGKKPNQIPFLSSAAEQFIGPF